MWHHELGELSGPVLLFGGPYSNRHALDALHEVARTRSVPPERMICTGDVVAYCGAPARSVAMMRAMGGPVVAGNCERQLGQGAEDCGCGFEQGSTCDMLSVGWYGIAQTALNAQDRMWMAQTPDVISFEHAGARYGVIHGGATDIARFIWSTSPDAVFAEEWAALEAAIGPVDNVIAGHSGIAFQRRVGVGRWINAGVIGMPPHNGCRETEYVILDDGRVEICALSYDAEAAAAEMASAGLPDGYREGLLSGYWPSEDVLPPELRVLASESG